MADGDTNVGGFMGGYMTAGNYQSNQTQMGDQHQAAMQDLAKGKLQIAQTQQLLDAQAAAMMELKGHSPAGKGGAPGTQGGIGGIAAQSYNASELAFAAGDVYMRHGLVEQGTEFMEKGAKLAESGSALEVHQAAQQAKMWSHVGSVLDTVHEGSPTAAQDWDKARMTFPLMFPDEAKHPEVQKFLSKPYDPQTVDLLKRASVTAQQQAELQKTKAEAKKDEASARFEDAGIPLRKAEAREHDARATAISKAGGKPPPAAEVNNAKSLIQADYPEADPKGYQLYATEVAERAKGLMTAGLGRDEAFQQAYSELNDSGKLKNLPAKASAKATKSAGMRAEIVDDIDDLVSDMEASPGAAGMRGKLGRVGEFASTTTGIGDQETPLTSIVAKSQLIHDKLQTALTDKYFGKDRQELMASLSDITRLGVSDKTAIAKLRAVQERLRAADNNTIKGKGAQPVSYKSEADISAAIDAKKIKDGDEIIFNGKKMKVQVK